MSEPIQELLHRAASTVKVSTVLPDRVARRSRRGQLILSVMGVSLVAGLSFAATNFGTPTVPIPPASRPGGLLHEGNSEGTPWSMHLEHALSSDEEVCIRAGGRSRCFGTSGFEYGDVTAAVGYVEALDRTIVIIKTMSEAESPSIDQEGGPLWGGLVAQENDPDEDGAAFWYRLFPAEVSGRIEVYGAEAPPLDFEVKPVGDVYKTQVDAASGRWPRLEGFDGETETLGGSVEAGGYEIIKRTTDDRVCFHLRDNYTCRAIDAVADPFGVVAAQPLKCAPDDDCGRGNDLMIVFGELSENVVKVGIGGPRQDKTTGSFVLVGPPGPDCCFFEMMNYYGNAGDLIEVVAFDAANNVLGSIVVTALDRQ